MYIYDQHPKSLSSLHKVSCSYRHGKLKTQIHNAKHPHRDLIYLEVHDPQIDGRIKKGNTI